MHFNTLLSDSSPQELREYVSSCENNEDLVAKLEKDPARLSSFIQNMKTEGNEQLAERLSNVVYKLTPDQLNNSDIKKVETLLRNRGMLNRNIEPDIALQQQEAVGPSIKAHRSVLALESPYFMGLADFSEFQKGELVMEQMGISLWAYNLAVEYLYSSDEKRKDLISQMDKALLLDMIKLADYWQVEELKADCDEELCNSIGYFAIEKDDLPNWLEQAQVHPKFAALLRFIENKPGQEGGV